MTSHYLVSQHVKEFYFRFKNRRDQTPLCTMLSHAENVFLLESFYKTGSVDDIRGNTGLFFRVWANLLHRCKLVVEKHGEHIEPLSKTQRKI